MSLFGKVLDALDDPSRVASSGQLGSIFDTVQQVSRTAQSDPATIQSALGIVGKYVRTGLQAERKREGEAKTEEIVDRYSGTQPSEEAVLSVLSTPLLKQLVAELENRTGLSFDTIETLLPVLVPLVLQLLQSGRKNDRVSGNNSVLSHFLDTDRDGDVDVTDAMQMAAQYLRR